MIDTDTETTKRRYAGLLTAEEARWLVVMGALVCAIAVTIGLSSTGGTKKPAAVVSTVNPDSLAGRIEAFLHASSIQQLKCTQAVAGRRTCQVEFTDQYGTWYATLVVGRHDAVTDPGGNANWLCASACTPLPKTTGLPRNAGATGTGTTINHVNQGVVNTSSTTASQGTGAPAGAAATTTATTTTPGGYTGATPGDFTTTPTTGGYTGATPGDFTGTTGGGYTGATGGGYTGATPGDFTGATGSGYTGATPGDVTGTTAGGYTGATPGDFTGGGYTGSTGGR
jgi:hypothetical protein